MSFLLPLIPDLLPMIMPSSVHIAKAENMVAVPAPPAASPQPVNGTNGEETETGVVQKDAVVHKSDKMCARVVVAKPKSSSSVHHYGEHDAIIYAVTGPGFLLTHSGDEDAEPKRNELSAGDFAFVPPWTEHQMVNETDNEITWVVIQSASEPLQVDLTEWGGAEIKHAK